ncbi:hypothetical protein IFM89_027941 [Coptis chinensis]|uniref:Uncharacterized protein n=1 Tax=Coptis chinensis TaxID=261450 RepID=A0A835IGH9_9MAGN|nr:hypothetical protein IFM89_027941 [Coptis chinensis]
MLLGLIKECRASSDELPWLFVLPQRKRSFMRMETKSKTITMATLLILCLVLCPIFSCDAARSPRPDKLVYCPQCVCSEAPYPAGSCCRCAGSSPSVEIQTNSP